MAKSTQSGGRLLGLVNQAQKLRPTDCNSKYFTACRVKKVFQKEVLGPTKSCVKASVVISVALNGKSPLPDVRMAAGSSEQVSLAAWVCQKHSALALAWVGNVPFTAKAGEITWC